MIPTMMSFGLLFGRWWKTSLILGVLGWPTLLLTEGTLHSPEGILGAAGLGLLNTLVGVVVHQVLRRALRALPARRRVESQSHARSVRARTGRVDTGPDD